VAVDRGVGLVPAALVDADCVLDPVADVRMLEKRVEHRRSPHREDVDPVGPGELREAVADAGKGVEVVVDRHGLGPLGGGRLDAVGAEDRFDRPVEGPVVVDGVDDRHVRQVLRPPLRGDSLRVVGVASECSAGGVRVAERPVGLDGLAARGIE
jgi:hypothetical protein